MELQNCINYLLTAAQHDVFVVFSERLAEFGVTPGQYGALACVWSQGFTTPKEIAQTLHLDSSTVSGMLDKMQKRGLVNRVLDPDDRRSIRVEATEAGMAIKEDVLRTVSELNQSVLAPFTDRQRQELLRLLHLLCDTLETAG
ncbi:MarR family transcriptional regulator [Pseudoflavonifractor capillosus]|uniref:MarR family transcriptional regulator n=1 Tax=Pseudoflavonifractor capillosus TaxID=106588 RepID=A0A921MJY5_9FIRM|nr:MarR family transcriptional regulator [Pseudoflavonifractor capillosus]HJG85512.1 MarR family transcriptional regulator [Pseudoflavonifractor capillosus]